MELILVVIVIIWVGKSISKSAKQRPAPRPRRRLDPFEQKLRLILLLIFVSPFLIVIPNDILPVYIKILIVCGIILAFAPHRAEKQGRKPSKSPFEYPYYTHEFDVTGRRNPNIDDCLDTFLMNGGFEEIQEHQRVIEEWKIKCERQLRKKFLYSYRRKQYEEVLDDESAFEFSLVRSQTQYRQNNYVISANKTYVEIESLAYCYDYIENRYWQLQKIGFECTLRDYEGRYQRAWITRDPRESMMRRGSYTAVLPEGARSLKPSPLSYNVSSGTEDGQKNPRYKRGDGEAYEHYVAYMLKNRKGFDKVEVTQLSGDRGADIVAVKDDIKYCIQCKNYSSAVSPDAVREVLASLNYYKADIGMVITNSVMTAEAHELADVNRIRIWERFGIDDMDDIDT